MPSNSLRHLRDAFAGRAGDEVALVSAAPDRAQAVTVAEMARRLAAAAPLRTAARGRRVVIAAADPFEFIFRLLVFDGAADAVLLLPADLPAEQAQDFAARAGCKANMDAGDGVAEGALQAADDAPVRTSWTLPTSGTTGIPRLVSHTLASLTRTARPRREANEQPLRWGLLYDPSRFAGLQVALQALISAAPLILVERSAPIAEQLLGLAAAECNALSATPTLWRKLLMVGAAQRLNLSQITLGGEIADAAILAALRRAWPAARITHIYASTEAGVGFSVHDGREGFPASYAQISDRRPGGVEVRVDEEGRLWLRPAQVEQRFLGGEQELVDVAGWIDTGDLVRREGERFLFLGRASGAINVGGNKVHPEEVERVIVAVPGVAQALVRSRRSSITGALVEALVVPEPSSASAEERAAVARAVQQQCAAALPPHKQPARVTVVDELPVGSAGKIVRDQR